MTVLPSQAERDSIGIDTYERAILYAATMLRRSFLVDGEKENKKALSITTAQSRDKNNILIEGEFPYSNSVTWEQGGDVFKPVHYLSLSDPSNAFTPPSPLIPFGSPYVSLPSDPAWVETLEEYFVWALSQAKAALHLESPPRHDILSYRFFDSRSPLPIVEVKAALPFDLDLWLRERHFFNALLPLLKYSPFIKAIQANGFIKKSVIQSFDRKINIYYDANPVTPVKFARKSEVETILDLYAKIYRDPQAEILRTTFIESSGQKFTTDTSEFIRTSKVLTPIGKTFEKISRFTTQRFIETLTDKKDPIIEQQQFTRKALISSSDETTIRKTLPTYNSVIPIVIPTGTVREDHENFVVHLFAEDINWGVRPEDWQNWSNTQKLKFVRSVRVKGGVGDALPTYNRFSFITNEVDGELTIRPVGYIYFLAKNLAKDADNVFYLNFNSSTVDDNPDEKQVFQDYLWVSLADVDSVERELAGNLNWVVNQSSSDVFNDIITDDQTGKVRLSVTDGQPLPLDGWAGTHIESENVNLNIETNGIDLDDKDATKPTLTMWSTQGSDQIAIFNQLSWDRRTKTQTINSIDKDNNTFNIPNWEDDFDEDDVIYIGKVGSGSIDDGDIIDNNASGGDGVQADAFENYDGNNEKYLIVKVDADNIKLTSWEDLVEFDIATVNDSDYVQDSFRIVGNKDLQTNNLPERPLNSGTSTTLREGYRRYDRTIDGSYLNGDLNNSEPLLPLSGIPTLKINFRVDDVHGYVKLAKYTKSQNRILDEIKNETNPQSFYEIGALEDVSKFERKATINSSEVIPISSADYIAKWTFDATDSSVMTDVINGKTIGSDSDVTTGLAPLANDGGNSIELDDTRKTIDDVETLTAIENRSFTMIAWAEKSNRVPTINIGYAGGAESILDIEVRTDDFQVSSFGVFGDLVVNKNDSSFVAVVLSQSGTKIYKGGDNEVILEHDLTDQYLFIPDSPDARIKLDSGFDAIMNIDNFFLFNIPLKKEQLDQLYNGEI